MCDLYYSYKLIMLNISGLHERININMTYTSSAYDGDQPASVPTFYTIRSGHPFYNHATQIASALLQTSLRAIFDFIGGVKIRVALRQIAINHWPHLGPTMYLP
jgi:hypothetical protein